MWVLVDVEARKTYADPNMRYVRYCGGEDFAMFSHTMTNDVLEALQFDSCQEAFAYLDKHQNGLPSPDTTYPREATIKVSVRL